MSDGITEARKGTYFSDRSKKGSIEIDGKKIPNPKAHQRISFVKSSIRIIGYSLIPFSLEAACAFLIFSEIIGIIEELV